MEKCTKKGTALIFVGVALCISAFISGVNMAGIVLMAAGIMSFGYGAGTVMDSPCDMVKR